MSKRNVSLDIVISDTHVGHKTGLIYPDKLEDYKPNDMQRWLFKVWHDNFLPDVKAIIKDVKPTFIHGLTAGDMGDADFKNRSTQFWTKDINQIKSNANDLLEPFFELCNAVHCIKGTRSYTGQNSQIDEAIADNFDNVVKQDDYNNAWYRCEYELSGVLVDAQHRGKNRSKWAKENLITALRQEIIVDRSMNNRRIPDVVYRGHFHWWGDTSIHVKPYVVQVPSFQLPNDFIAEIDPVGGTPKVGGFVAVYQNGKIADRFPLTYTYKEEPIWRPK